MHPQLDHPTLRRDNLLIAGWSLLVSIVTLWPFWQGLSTGNEHNTAYALRDMMVPTDLSLNDLNTGTTSNAARNLPQDTLLAILSPTFSAVILCSFLVIAAGLLGGFYAARMIRDMTGGGVYTQMAAALLVMWNPFTIERFLQGQWSIAAVAMLTPALAYSMAGHRWGSWALHFTAAAVVPTGAMLATIVSFVFARSKRDRWLALGVGFIMSTPWILPTVLSGSDTSATLSNPVSAELFAARAEDGVGTLGSLMSLGGIWNSEAVAPSMNMAASFAGLLLAGILFTRICELWRVYRGVAILTISAIIIPAFLATEWGLDLMGWAISTIPGAGLLRDTQKFVCLAIPGYILLLGSLVGSYAEASERNRWSVSPRAITAVSCTALMALNVLMVPGFPKDMAPLRTKQLSVAWQQMSDALYSAPLGRTLMLPPGSYQQRGDFPSLSPGLKVLPGEPLDPGYLIVDGTLVDGDQHIMGLLESAMKGDVEPLEQEVSWVLIDTRLPGSTRRNPEIQPAIDALESHGYPAIVNMDGYRLYRVTEGSPTTDHSAQSMPIADLSTNRGTDAESASRVPLLASLLGIVLYWAVFAAGVGLWISRRIRQLVRHNDLRSLSQAVPVANHEKD